MAKLVYIAHPLSGDVDGNVKKILQICYDIHSEEIIPFAPYLVAVQYLDDDVKEEREMGIQANKECFHREVMDEVWVYGDEVSSGMKEELKLAKKYDIPVEVKEEKIREEVRDIV